MKLAQLTVLALAFAGLATLLQGRTPEHGVTPPIVFSPSGPDPSSALGTRSTGIVHGLTDSLPGERVLPLGPLGQRAEFPPSSGCGSIDSEVACPANRALPLREYLRALILPPEDGASDPGKRAAAAALLERMLELDGGLEHWHVRSVDLRPIS